MDDIYPPGTVLCLAATRTSPSPTATGIGAIAALDSHKDNDKTDPRSNERRKCSCGDLGRTLQRKTLTLVVRF